MPTTDADDHRDTTAPAPRRRLRDIPVFGFLAIGAVTLVFAVGWGVAVSSYGGNLHTVPHQVMTWRVVSDSEVSVTFQVNSREPAVCLVTATDEYHVEVGQDQVTVEAGLRDVTHGFETTRRASMVEITSCREQSL